MLWVDVGLTSTENLQVNKFRPLATWLLKSLSDIGQSVDAMESAIHESLVPLNHILPLDICALSPSLPIATKHHKAQARPAPYIKIFDDNIHKPFCMQSWKTALKATQRNARPQSNSQIITIIPVGK